MVAQKVLTAKVTKADTKAIRLTKINLQGIHLKDFDCDVSKAIKRVREIVSALEANNIDSKDHLDNALAMFKDKSCCEDFCLHLKMFKMDKLKGNTIDIDSMLTELDSKHTSLLRQNKWMVSKAASLIDTKYMAINAESKAPFEQNLLLQALLISLQQKPSSKPANWVDLKKVPAPKGEEP